MEKETQIKQKVLYRVENTVSVHITVRKKHQKLFNVKGNIAQITKISVTFIIILRRGICHKGHGTLFYI